LEAEAELERDVAEACAAASREGLDGLPWKRYGHGRRRGRRAVHGGGGGVGGVDWCSDDDEYDEDVSDTDDAADDLELSDSEDGDNGDVRGRGERRRGGGRPHAHGGGDPGQQSPAAARRQGPELELRLTAHSGLILASAESSTDAGTASEEEG